MIFFQALLLLWYGKLDGFPAGVGDAEILIAVNFQLQYPALTGLSVGAEHHLPGRRGAALIGIDIYFSGKQSEAVRRIILGRIPGGFRIAYSEVDQYGGRGGGYGGRRGGGPTTYKTYWRH